MEKVWNLPSGKRYTLYKNMLEGGHLLIAGATGSGKSTVICGLIDTAIYDSPARAEFILIDPKRVDLQEYRYLPHTLHYATEPKQIADSLRHALEIMENRYTDMQRRRLKEFDGGRIYVIIDELADLLTDPANKRAFSPMIQRLAQLGRAAHVTVICATQCTLRSVISTEIKCNFGGRLALRTATAQDSRNIIDMKGAETLPDPRTTGKCWGIWRSGADTNLYALPRYDEADRQRIIRYWEQQRPRISLFGRRSA